MNTSKMKIDLCVEYYEQTVSKLLAEYQQQGQGVTRNSCGEMYERLAKMLMLSADDTLDIRKNDYMTIKSDSGLYSLNNVQVDWHVYKDNDLKLIVECKTYLDVCYLKRAVDDFETIRKKYPNVPAVIFTGQNAVGKNAWGYYNEMYDFETFVVNQTKKRSSKNPIYKTKDNLDLVEVNNFVNHVKGLLNVN